MPRSVPAFHASTSDTITTFLPLSHFGSRQAAIDVLTKNKGATSGFLYEVVLTLPDTTFLVPDLGTPRPLQALVAAMEARLLVPGADHKTNFMEMMKHHGPILNAQQGGKSTMYAQARQMVAKVLTDAGIGALEYVNQVEDIGSTSYLVVKPAQVQIVAVTPFP